MALSEELILGNLGSSCIRLGKYKEAEQYLTRAIAISVAIGNRNAEKYHHQYLSDLYEKTKRPALALEQYKKYIALRDTLFSQENTKNLRSGFGLEYFLAFLPYIHS